MKKFSMILFPAIVILIVVAAAVGWKTANDLKTSGSAAGRNAPSFNTEGTNASGGFGTTGGGPTVAPNAATSDIEAELDALIKTDDQSDLDALDKQVGSL